MKKIMIVDNETTNLEEAKSILENIDIEVITANNSREALEQINEIQENRLNLILINTQNPIDNKPSFFSIKPKSKMYTDTQGIENFLVKPYTKDELKKFVMEKL